MSENRYGEPWYVVPQIEIDPMAGTKTRTFPIYHKEGKFGHPATATKESTGNRIVACVNALAGIPDDALGKEPVRAVREALEAAGKAISAAYAEAHSEWHHHDHAAARHDAIVRDGRDKIRAALALLGKE